jgi:hypothetical protein
LAASLETNSTLTQLDLRNNKINDVGAIALGIAWKKNSKLTNLLVDGNIGIKEANKKMLEKIAQEKIALPSQTPPPSLSPTPTPPILPGKDLNPFLKMSPLKQALQELKREKDLVFKKANALTSLKEQYKSIWTQYSSPSSKPYSLSIGKNKARIQQIIDLEAAIEKLNPKDNTTIEALKMAITKCSQQLAQETRYLGKSKLELILTSLNIDLSKAISAPAPKLPHETKEEERAQKSFWKKSPPNP